MQIDIQKLEVINNPNEKRFETWIDDKLSKLDYIEAGKILSSRMWACNQN